MEPTQHPPDGDGQQVPDAPGPPPPPFVREKQARRRRRRRLVLAGVVILLVLALPVAMVSFGLFATEGSDVATDEGVQESPEDDGASDDEADRGADEGGEAEGSEQQESEEGDAGGDASSGEASGGADTGDLDLGPTDQAGRPDREVPQSDQLDPPDLGNLDSDEVQVGEMLLDIDASERTMLGYQLDAQAAFTDGFDLEEPDELFEELRVASQIAQANLATLRERLEPPLDDATADRVRETYVVHLDSWVRYLEAIEDDPSLLLGDTARYTLDINRTGDAYKRATDELLATDLDGELRRYADAIAERGFPESEDDSQV